MRRTIITTVADVVGVLLLAAFAFYIWRPAALAVVGVALLLASYAHARPPGAVLQTDDEGVL